MKTWLFSSRWLQLHKEKLSKRKKDVLVVEKKKQPTKPQAWQQDVITSFRCTWGNDEESTKSQRKISRPDGWWNSDKMTAKWKT